MPKKKKPAVKNLPKLIGQSQTYVIRLPHSDGRWVYCSTKIKTTDAGAPYENALEMGRHLDPLIAMRRSVPAAQHLLDAMITAEAITLSQLPTMWDDVSRRNTVVIHGGKRALDPESLAALLWRELTNRSLDHWINVWAELPPEPIHKGKPARPEQKRINLRHLRQALPDAKDLTPDWLTAANITARINSLVSPQNGKPYGTGTKTNFCAAFSMLCHYLVRDDVQVIMRNPCLGNRVTFQRTPEEELKEENKRGYTREETLALCETPAPPRKLRDRYPYAEQTTVHHYRAAIALAWAAGIERQVIGLLRGKDFFGIEMDDDYRKEAERLGIPLETLQTLFRARGTKTRTRDRVTMATNLELWDRFIWPVVKDLKPNQFLLPRSAKGKSARPQWTRLNTMHREICAAAGVPILGRWHAFRHGHASAMDDAIGTVEGMTTRFANQTGGWSQAAKTRKQKYVHGLQPAEFLATASKVIEANERTRTKGKRRSRKVLPFALGGARA